MACVFHLLCFLDPSVNITCKPLVATWHDRLQAIFRGDLITVRQISQSPGTDVTSRLYGIQHTCHLRAQLTELSTLRDGCQEWDQLCWEATGQSKILLLPQPFPPGKNVCNGEGLLKSSVCVQCKCQGYGLIYYTYVCFLGEHLCEALSFENRPLNSLKLDFDVPELPVPPVIMTA